VASKFSASQLSKKLKLVKEEDSNASFIMAEDESNSNLNIDDDFGDDDKSDNDDNDEEGSLATVDIEGFSDNAMSREPARPTSPLFDFLGEKLGPKRCRARTGGKRGRPRGIIKPGGVGGGHFRNPVGVDLFTRAPGARQINPN